jgi:alkylresorcinol/alkylpyrone synthase/polyketide synthase Type III
LSSKIISVGTATPKHAFSQQDVLDRFDVTDRKTRLVFLNSAIERRFLSLPDEPACRDRQLESQGELLQKHKKVAVDIGARAIKDCLEKCGLGLEDIRYLCCVTTTGLLTPGLSALLCSELGLRTDCTRLDIVGMGCNAGLNGISSTSAWSATHPGDLAICLCVEICSAAYVFDGTIETSVVNSLFGDGASAVALMSGAQQGTTGPTIRKFASQFIPSAIDAMRFDWSDEHGKFSFFLSKDVPYVVGAHAEQVIDRLLEGTGLRRNQISHWLIHSGGKKVIDSVRVNLGLSTHDVRHTTSVLKDYGNMSSGSFLFSYERLLTEGTIRPEDYGIMMTMGPGATIETALLHWVN